MAWEAQIAQDGPCNTSPSGRLLLESHTALIAFSWLYFILGTIFFGLILTMHGLDEGTCTTYEVCKAFALAITCGQYKLQKNTKQKLRRR